MMMINNVEDMPVYKLMYSLAIEVEHVSKDFDRDFTWLRIQMMKSSESVCANMSEGFYAQYSTEYLQSLYRSRLEARETLTHISYATDVGQLLLTFRDSLQSKYEDGLHQLANLITSIERKIAALGKSKPLLLKDILEEYA